MNASQMNKEFEIAYESIASNGAPGYEAYEKSILLTQAQNDIIKEIVTSGIERDDIRALVIGPHIKQTNYITAKDPDFTDGSDVGATLTATYSAPSTTIVVSTSGAPLQSVGTLSIVSGYKLKVTISGTLGSNEGEVDQLIISGAGISETLVNSEITSYGSTTYTATSSDTITFTYSTSQDSTTLTITTEITPVLDMYQNSAFFELSVSNMWLIVNERIKETLSSTPLEVKPIEHAFLDANINNPFKKPQTGRYFWRLLQFGETTGLFTTPNFVIIGLSTFSTYYINYLEKPTPIMVPATVGTIDGVTAGNSVAVSGIGTIDITANGLDCAFNSLIHRDIVKRAAYLGAAYVSDPESFQLLMNTYKN